MLDTRAHGAGRKIPGFPDNGIRNVSHAFKAVPAPADLIGMKIRTPPDQMTVHIFEAPGAAPAPLAWGSGLDAATQVSQSQSLSTLVIRQVWGNASLVYAFPGMALIALVEIGLTLMGDRPQDRDPARTNLS